MEPLTREETAELADLYDRFAHAFDPFSSDAERAEVQFYDRLERLHSTLATPMLFDDFRRATVRACKAFLRRNP